MSAICGRCGAESPIVVHRCPVKVERPREDEKEPPCNCGGKGRGFRGFHYEGTEGCLKRPPSDATLAKMLAAWVEWAAAHPDKRDAPCAPRMLETGLMLDGLISPDATAPTPAGNTLLDRARKAGLL